MSKSFMDSLEERSERSQVKKVTRTGEVTTKRKVGRPKKNTEPMKYINIAVDENTMHYIKIAKFKHNDNITDYINDLIKADIKKNKKHYDDLEVMIKK